MRTYKPSRVSAFLHNFEISKGYESALQRLAALGFDLELLFSSLLPITGEQSH